MRDSKGRFAKGYKPVWSEESRRKVSETCKKRGIGKWMIGRKPSKETRKKLSQNSARHWLGKKRPDVSGEKHHLWKKERTPRLTKNLIRQDFKYRQWRSDVFTRDGYACVICGRKQEVSGRLEADHYPKSFADILSEYRIKTAEEALKCEELWNINNGRTLCQDCHKETDNYFYKAILKGHRRDLSEKSDR